MDLAEELQKLQLENAHLRGQLRSFGQADNSISERGTLDDPTSSCATWRAGGEHALDQHMIHRYSRQLLVPAFGVQGQQKLLNSSILVVGAGGLGSSAALYLAAAGIGCLGIVDHDDVELNNLHRQIIHSESSIGHSKVQSAAMACRAINSTLKVVEHHAQLTSCNSVALIKEYDVVVDATDNVPTRYLISDTCVALGKPLVSGAALGMDGQLTVYNYEEGPCYRCLFPVPPPQGACQRCSDSGVLGVVPGIIGTFQALEAIKIASGVGDPLSRRMLILDALSTSIRVVKLRNRNPDCSICSEGSHVTAREIEGLNYESFTGSSLSDKNPKPLSVIPESQRITVKEYHGCLKEGQPHLLLDVREAHQYAISALRGSLNIPLAALKDRLSEVEAASQESPVIVVCRRGNDSQLAVKFLRESGKLEAVDIVGGLESWAKDIDPLFPIY
ncbi:hypothetical protein GOP47_0013405 [Adiantum capillus-veneris]|uniref:Adenylyltransferase and sulfurtransferase MOCS3 n=1 Tax=Adiantum capillus-veneris TaxID=13818 RepID=A0A9D4ZDD5_ADICA|nr:hypothetical protein GOP47_0013405 [Adiantum capillus-veneris]